MNVILISPGFPAEMPLFTAGLAKIGARVLGVGDTPKAALAPEVASSLSAYLQVDGLWDEETTVPKVRDWVRGHQIHRVECLWEPGMLLAAHLREALGVPGLTVQETHPFRDKELMKQVLDAAGVRTPRHARAGTQDEVRSAAKEIGYPLIVKPIDGAGSADTYRIEDESELEQALGLVRHVDEVSVEEYIEGEEFTFDTVCAGGEILFQNIAWYRPKPLLMRHGWVSPQSICFKDLDREELRAGRELGYAVLEALGFKTGFAHMEWFLTPDGEAVFGEIGARPPGARLVHAMNYSADIDLFTGWAEAVCTGRLSQDTRKLYNAAMVFKRAQGAGQKIARIEGLDTALARYGEHIVNIELSAVGARRQDWQKVVVGDGWIVGRHPNLEVALEIAECLANDVRIVAG